MWSGKTDEKTINSALYIQKRFMEEVATIVEPTGQIGFHRNKEKGSLSGVL